MAYLDTVLRELKREKRRWKEIALKAQVSRLTLANIAAGITRDPRIKTLQRIEKAIATLQAMPPAAADIPLVKPRDDEGAAA